MPVPVINQTTSVLVWDRGRYHSAALALAPGSSAATSWAVLSGGFPEGVALNTSTGRISGTPQAEAEGSVFTAAVVARNASGDSIPLTVTIGVYWADVSLDGSVEMFFDLDHGGVRFARQTEIDEKTGAALVRWKRGDVFPLSVVFLKGAEAVDLSLEFLALVMAEEIDGKKYRLDDQTLTRLGIADKARYQIAVDLSAQGLAGLLGGEESLDLKIEIEAKFSFAQNGATRTATRSSQTFVVRLFQDLKA
jgi:hypothetical protein